MTRVRNWKVDLVRALSVGVGSVLSLTVAGWPGDAAVAAWVGLAGGVMVLALAFGVEYVLRLCAEVRRLHDIEQELASARKLWDQERGLRDEQLALARREAAIAAVDVEIWGGAYNEAVKTGNFLPLAAILARRENLMTARNLNTPLPSQSRQSQGKRAA